MICEIRSSYWFRLWFINRDLFEGHIHRSHLLLYCGVPTAIGFSLNFHSVGLLAEENSILLNSNLLSFSNVRVHSRRLSLLLASFAISPPHCPIVSVSAWLVD